jgi:mannose-6-phosphate isomerase-like protein (cupin superfamily)
MGTDYKINMGVLHGHQELIDVNELVKRTTDKWVNYTLTEVNSSVVRVGILEGEFHWHKHDNDDEFFFVLEGQLLIDLDPDANEKAGRTIELNAGQGTTISKGVLHCPRAPKKTVVLMVETNAIVPTGD